MMGHPGKKLLFMGQEFAQLREWSEERELDWFLLAEEPHQQIQNWYKDLLHLYKKNKALYELDNDPKGFDWINKDDIFRSIFKKILYIIHIFFKDLHPSIPPFYFSFEQY